MSRIQLTTFSLIGLFYLSTCQAFPAPSSPTWPSLPHDVLPPTRRQQVDSSSPSASSSPSSSASSTSLTESGGPMSGLTIIVPLAFLVGAGIIAGILYVLWHRKHRNDPPPVRRMPAVRPRQYLSRQESGASVRSLPRYSIQAGEQELVLARQSSNLAEELYRQNRIPNSGESADHQLPTGGSIIGSLMRTVTSTSLSRGPAPSYLEATVSSTQGSDVERGTIERVPTNQKEASQPSSGFRRFFTMPRFGGKSQPTQRSTDVPEMTQLAVPRPAVTTTRAHVDSHSQPRNSSQSLLLRPLDSRHSTDSSGSHGRHSTIGGSPSFRTSYDAPRAGFTPDQMRFLSAHEGIDLTRVHIGAQESGGARIPPPRFEEVESNGSRGVEVVTGASEGEGSPVAPVRTLLASRGQAERGESGGRESRPQ